MLKLDIDKIRYLLEQNDKAGMHPRSIAQLASMTWTSTEKGTTTNYLYQLFSPSASAKPNPSLRIVDRIASTLDVNPQVILKMRRGK